MKIIEQYICIRDESLVLTNQRAIYWKRQNALILSDLHIGKTAHFRKHGIPMSDVILQKDLNRLENLILHFKVEKLVVVGDLFHAEANTDIGTFKNWLQKFKDLEVILIKGNHDRLEREIMTNFEFRVVRKLDLPPFLFVHEYLGSDIEKFTISGHMHPGILIKGKGKQSIKLPCYQVTSSQIILPAFSLFTGLNTNRKPKNSDSYAFTSDSFYLFQN